MKLEEGRNAFVSLIDKTTGEILYTANLVDDILMFRGDAGEPPYSLECDHDFPITLKLKYEKETWMLIQATCSGLECRFPPHRIEKLISCQASLK